MQLVSRQYTTINVTMLTISAAILSFIEVIELRIAMATMLVITCAGALAHDRVLSWALLRFGVFNARPVRTRTQLVEAWNVGKDTYTGLRKAYPALSVVEKWWQCFQQAEICLTDSRDTSVASISVWPVTEACFNALKSGELGEDDINEQHICKGDDGEPSRYWYVADICRFSSLKADPSTTCYVIGQLVSAWIGENLRKGSIRMDRPCEFVAFAATIAGRKLLDRFGFVHAGRNATGQAIYHKDASTECMAVMRSTALSMMSKHYWNALRTTRASAPGRLLARAA